MRNRVTFVLSLIGITLGLVCAYYFSIVNKPQPPLFKPVSSPYASAIYANGIIESDQKGGSNINVYSEVSGTITQVFVQEGQHINSGAPLFAIDSSVQQANTEQIRLQAVAAKSLLTELEAQPRTEVLAIAKAQVVLAESNFMVIKNQYDKRLSSYNINPKSVSADQLDSVSDGLNQAKSAVEVAKRQFELTKAGAWHFDIDYQKKQYEALQQAYNASIKLLQKYTVRAQTDAVVLSVGAAVGSYASSLGIYNSYTEATSPLIVMSAPQEHMAVRCYVDEILISKLPSPEHIRAELSIRGSDMKVPLEFVRVQPYVSPKIELSNQRQEKVDLRVLPVIFRFKQKDAPTVYPGQLVDVYIGAK